MLNLQINLYPKYKNNIVYIECGTTQDSSHP